MAAAEVPLLPARPLEPVWRAETVVACVTMGWGMWEATDTTDSVGEAARSVALFEAG